MEKLYKATADGVFEFSPEDYIEYEKIQKENAERIRIQEANKYKELRREAYPPMADYLDGIVKGDQAQIDAYIAACLAVKAKYPKPE